MNGSLVLGCIGGSITIEACADRWRIVASGVGVSLRHPADWPREWLDSAEAWQLMLQLTHLLELGVAESGPDEISIPWDRFGQLTEAGFSLPLLWSEWSPLRISISGEPDRLTARFFLGGLETSIQRAGRYVRRAGHRETWLLDDSAFHLLEVLERPRSGDQHWITLGFLSCYASELCASTTGWLAGNEVIFPAAILSQTRPRLLQKTLDASIAEADGRAFRHALAARVAGTRHLPVFVPDGRWQHIIFDDAQISALDRDSPSHESSGVTLSGAGRIATREAAFCSNPEVLPARLRPDPPSLTWKPLLSNRHSPIRTLRRAHIEALVSADFALRGYDSILLPRGCWTGASIMAVSDRDVCLIRIETDAAGEESLSAAVRMAAEHRRLCEISYRVAIVSLHGCEPQTRMRAEAAGIRVLGLRDLINPALVTEEHIQEHESRRCRSLLEGLEQLSSASP